VGGVVAGLAHGRSPLLMHLTATLNVRLQQEK